ncbi:MAG: hypothetical protein NTZ05_22335, partial [Chloroflexi bacterium]|nr:hypothetical protein [Chloroflexota bacterium]
MPGGHFFTQTGSNTLSFGFAVLDDAQAPLWTEYQRLGGAALLGYPISHRFEWNGALSQATQRAVLQWRPREGRAA